jgi:hypothetical protein
MAKSSGGGGTIITILVALVGGYFTLRMFAQLNNGQQQQTSLLAKLMNSLKSGGSKSGSAGSSGSKPSPFSGLSGSAAAALAALKQAISDGNAEIKQLSTSIDTTSLPLIDSTSSLQDAWSVLGQDFGFDPSVFNQPSLSPNDSTDYTGNIPTSGISDAWSVLGNDFGFDPSSFAGDAGGVSTGGHDVTDYIQYDNFSPELSVE